MGALTMLFNTAHAQPAPWPEAAPGAPCAPSYPPLAGAPCSYSPLAGTPGSHSPLAAAPLPPTLRAEPTPAQLLLFVGEAIRPDAALTALLAREGLRSLCLPGAEQALRAAALARFDAVLIDAALVDGRAARAIDTLASTHRCPVVVLAGEAADTDEVDEIVALEFGADLYLTQPLSPRRLRAHLGALLRRRAAQADTSSGDEGCATAPLRTLQAAGWTLELAQQRLTRGSRSVRLTLAQAALLHRLMAAAGAIVRAEDLLAALPHHGRLQVRSLRVNVHRLRQRLQDEGVGELRLEAVRGSGYALAVACEQAA